MGRNTSTRGQLHTGGARGSNTVHRDLPRGGYLHGNKPHKNNSHRLGHKLSLCLYSVGLLFGSPAMAETQQTAIANPTAVSSGSAVNQAIQVVNSQYFQQHYGGGVSCQGTTLVVAPFAINGLQAPDSQMRTDFGVSMQVSVPLDREGVRECKKRARAATARAQAETDKAQLDYQMVRALKCAELISAGAFLNPASPYAGLCADVIATAPDGSLRTGTGLTVSAAPTPRTPSPSSEV